MNDDERALVHYKRRLRNRESAKRSRARRQATICDLQTEVDELRGLTTGLADRCIVVTRSNERQAVEIETLRKEKLLQGLEIETLRKEKLLLESLLRSSDTPL